MDEYTGKGAYRRKGKVMRRKRVFRRKRFKKFKRRYIRKTYDRRHSNRTYAYLRRIKEAADEAALSLNLSEMYDAVHAAEGENRKRLFGEYSQPPDSYTQVDEEKDPYDYPLVRNVFANI
jgi:hypothetical protein